jgi:hypothetical protein
VDCRAGAAQDGAAAALCGPGPYRSSGGAQVHSLPPLHAKLLHLCHSLLCVKLIPNGVKAAPCLLSMLLVR